VVDEPLAHDGHGLEAPVRVLREARHHVAVVHVPAVAVGEIAADVAAREGGRGPERLVARGVRVVVVHAEQEGVGRAPRGNQGGEG
jgi:hypothetical protein